MFKRTAVIGALLAAAVFGCILSGCSFEIERTTILPGADGKCSEKLRDYMADHYSIFIPDHAVFIGGYFDNAPRDPAVCVAFDIPLSEWNGYEDGMEREEMIMLLSNGEEILKHGSYNGYAFISSNYDDHAVKLHEEEFGRDFGWGYSFYGPNQKGYSYIVCSDPKDGVISFLFSATGCGNAFE